jgi:hypothetical protein
MATSHGDHRSYVTTGGIPNEFELVTKATYSARGRRRFTRRYACRWPARHDSPLPCRMRGIPTARIIVRNEFEHAQRPAGIRRSVGQFILDARKADGGWFVVVRGTLDREAFTGADKTVRNRCDEIASLTFAIVSAIRPSQERKAPWAVHPPPIPSAIDVGLRSAGMGVRQRGQVVVFLSRLADEQKADDHRRYGQCYESEPFHRVPRACS